MAKETGFKIYTSIERPSKEIIEQYRGFVAANISDSMGRLFTMDYRINPVYKPMRKLCGTAVTVQARPGDNLLSLKAIEIAQPGDVIVIATQGDTALSVRGGFMSMMAARRGIAGVVTDGVIRDVEQSREAGLPIYAVGVTPAAPTKEGTGQINTSISCGGVVVEPGDIVVGDDDGVLFISPADAEALAAAGRKKLADETATLAAIAGGRYDDAWIDQTLRNKGVLPR